MNAKPRRRCSTRLVPSDLRKLAERDLQQLAFELRAELIDAVSQTGGHLGAGLAWSS